MTCRSEGGFSLPEAGVARGGVRRVSKESMSKRSSSLVKDEAMFTLLAEKIKIRIYMRKFNNLMAMHRMIIYIANCVDINGVVEFIVMNGRRRINRCRCSRIIDFGVRVYFARVVTA